ncbi:hypothetical protein [Mycobacterium vicinigordonae]|nr:hypothetical protein [Mycobacterium vicinigordonae]
MTTAEQPPPEGDKQPPQAASADEPGESSGARDRGTEGEATSDE